MRRRLRRIVALCALLPALPLVASLPARAQSSPYVVVALGDSYASGEGLYAGATPSSPGSWLTRGNHPAPHDDGCHRSPYAYPELVASAIAHRLRRPVTLRFLACSGATTSDLWPTTVRSPLLAGPEHLEAPQVSARALRQADLVTVTIGGNDVSFVSVLATCEFQPSLCSGSTGALLAAGVSARIDALAGVLTNLYGKIHQLAPRATIAAVEYPDLFPPSSTTSCQGLASGSIAYLYAAENHLNSVIASAARASGVRVVNPNSTELFNGHSVCSATSLFGGVHSSYLGAAFHPTRAGQSAIARAVELSVAG